MVNFKEANGERTARCNYTADEKFGWKLAKLARAAKLADSQMMNFAPSMLVGKSVIIEIKNKFVYDATPMGVDDDVPF